MKGSRVLCWVMVVAVMAGLCVGCEAFKPTPPPPPTDGETASKVPDVDGKWRVEWEDDTGMNQPDFDLRLDQDDGDLEGTANLGGAAWDVEGEVEEDDEIDFTLEDASGDTLEFKGEVTSKTKMEGTWKHPASGDKGDWNALKAS